MINTLEQQKRNLEKYLQKIKENYSGDVNIYYTELDTKNALVLALRVYFNNAQVKEFANRYVFENKDERNSFIDFFPELKENFNNISLIKFSKTNIINKPTTNKPANNTPAYRNTQIEDKYRSKINDFFENSVDRDLYTFSIVQHSITNDSRNCSWFEIKNGAKSINLPLNNKKTELYKNFKNKVLQIIQDESKIFSKEISFFRIQKAAYVSGNTFERILEAFAPNK